MTDIRPIKDSETERFLRLVCDVFGLDFNRAYDVFYSEPYYDPNRKWALFDGPEMLSVLTLTPLEFGWGQAVGIAGVATVKGRQGEGLASMLMERVLKECEKRGQGAALLFAQDTRLYDKLGFEALDRVVRGKLSASREEMDEPCSSARVREVYDVWASAHPDRLRRDPKRWEYWNWHFRTCAPFREGYLCYEMNVLREALFSGGAEELPLPEGAEWFGTTYMADALGLPMPEFKVELYLMGKNVPGLPQMFMTDQF